ncbi:MAG: hypothetical protein RLW61_17090 [Gammaproteobacteria bacterium]
MTMNTRGLRAASTLATVMLGCWLVSAPAGAGEAAFESAATLAASELLPQQVLRGPHHSVQEGVHNDGFLNTYIIESSWGLLKATSTPLLLQYIDELNAVARMEAVRGSDEFKQGMSEKVRDVARGAKRLVTDPIDSVTGIAAGVGSLFRRAGEAMHDDRSDYEGSRLAAVSGYASVKRDYAKEFGVDVYSRNPVTQKALEDLVDAGYAGKMTMAALVVAVPGAAGAAVSVSGNSQMLKNIASDLPPNELRQRNRDALAAMKVPADIADVFIANAVYTPREQTTIIEDLRALDGVEGRPLFVKLAVATETPDIAFFRQRQASMYAAYHANGGKLARFVPMGTTAASVTADGTLVFAAPVDLLRWTPEIASFADAASTAAAGAAGVKARRLLLGGKASAMARTQLEQRGWEVVEHSGKGA